MKRLKWLAAAIMLMLAAGCGGGGGGSNGGGNGAVSGYVPYLISTPSVSYKLSTFGTGTAYDVTVTLQADGPTGVADVSLWIFHATDPGIFTSLTLTHTPATKMWSASSYWFDPLPPGQYYIDSIELNDDDPINYLNKLRTGWYMIQPMFSNDLYFADERETLKSPLSIIYYNYGLTGFPIKRFTLP